MNYYTLNWDVIGSHDWFAQKFRYGEQPIFYINENHASDYDFFIDVMRRRSVPHHHFAAQFIGKTYFKIAFDYTRFFNDL